MIQCVLGAAPCRPAGRAHGGGRRPAPRRGGRPAARAAGRAGAPRRGRNRSGCTGSGGRVRPLLLRALGQARAMPRTVPWPQRPAVTDLLARPGARPRRRRPPPRRSWPPSGARAAPRRPRRRPRPAPSWRPRPARARASAARGRRSASARPPRRPTWAAAWRTARPRPPSGSAWRASWRRTGCSRRRPSRAGCQAEWGVGQGGALQLGGGRPQRAQRLGLVDACQAALSALALLTLCTQHVLAFALPGHTVARSGAAARAAKLELCLHRRQLRMLSSQPRAWRARRRPSARAAWPRPRTRRALTRWPRAPPRRARHSRLPRSARRQTRPWQRRASGPGAVA